jgi:hypothetical protein
MGRGGEFGVCGVADGRKRPCMCVCAEGADGGGMAARLVGAGLGDVCGADEIYLLSSGLIDKMAAGRTVRRETIFLVWSIRDLRTT